MSFFRKPRAAASAPAPIIVERPPLTLLSPYELANGNRFLSEDRCRGLSGAVYIGDHIALCRVFGRQKMYIDTRDVGFGAHVLLDGFWEMWATIFVVRNVRPGMTAIDVGANFGYYTLLLADLVGREGRVFAVEPNPAVATQLRRSVALNGFAQTTEVIEAAAGEVEGGEAHLYVPDGEPKNATIVASPAVVAGSPGVCHTVARRTVDRIAAAAPRVDFVKIDAEGAEEGVIDGMMGILTRDKPCLVLEFNAARYLDPGAFLRRLAGIYGALRYIDNDGNAASATEAQLTTERFGEDWLLCLDDPSRIAPA